MIFDASTLPLPMTIEADLCVVGSGAGGAPVARLAAEAGHRVVVLEAGEYLTPSDMTQREDEMFPRLFWEGGNRTTTDRAIKIHQGRGVGGSTLHNLNLVKRMPRSVIAHWQQTRGLRHLGPEALDALYQVAEAELRVSPAPRELWNRANVLLEEGSRALGWSGGPLLHNRTGCIGSGFCELGCAYDAKNHALKVFIAPAVKAGAEVLALCQAIRVLYRHGQVEGVEAVALHPRARTPLGRVTVRARAVCLSASATGTAALLLRSEVPAPDGAIGDSLRIHPALVVAGDFDEPVYGWRGIPQGFECTELLDFQEGAGRGSWIIPAFAHPVGVATLMPGAPELHREIMQRYAHLAAFTAVLHDQTKGRVRPKGDLGVRIDYTPEAGDLHTMRQGLLACVKLLFAAGAQRVLVPLAEPLVLSPSDSTRALEDRSITVEDLGLTAVHPMGTVPMADSGASAATSDGRSTSIEGLWIADGSLFPTSIGGPPQLSIYALGLHVGRALARSL